MRRLLALALLALALAAPHAEAQPVSTTPGATLRLIGGLHDGRADVGLEIALEPGWKTYWRMPGDAGIPPSFDSTASTGIAGVEVRFPLPVRFDEAGLTGIGYTETVLLPLDVRLADPAKPADLKIAVEIGLCRDICVPLSARVALRLDPAAPADPAAVARLASARAAMPSPANGDARPRVASLTRDTTTTPPTVTVEVVEPEGLALIAADLLVEGPTADWALPLPEPVAAAPGRRTWRFSLDGAPGNADLAHAPLRFTLRAGNDGRDQTVALDGTGVLP